MWYYNQADCFACYIILHFSIVSRCVGTGRRDRLKICCPYGRVGSSPTTGILNVAKTVIKSLVLAIFYFVIYDNTFYNTRIILLIKNHVVPCNYYLYNMNALILYQINFMSVCFGIINY